MSRELKFRCWNNCLRDYIPEEELLENFRECMNEDHLYIEQYIGLKDKNGKEIYEGDIVKIEAHSRVYQVVYRRWDCSFMFENDADEDIVHMFNGFPNEYEIIGNIHENPELLEMIK